MAAAEEHTRSGLSRRDALRMLAASTGTVAAASAIVSQPAFAANGSPGCTYRFDSDPQVTVVATNAPGVNADGLTISVSALVGSCQCAGDTPTVEYAYDVVTTAASGGTGWRSGWNAVFVTGPPVLWPTGGGQPTSGVVTVAVGVRVTCGETEVCRAGSGRPFTVANPSGSSTQRFSLASDTPASPLPNCTATPGGSSGSVTFDSGAGAVLRLEATVDEPAVDLAPVEPEPTATDATTTTTTTEVPAPSESSTSTTSTSPAPADTSAAPTVTSDE